MTGNSTLAMELVQETYLNAWKGLDSLADPNRMKGWLFAILRNQYSKLIRKESKSSTLIESMQLSIPSRPDSTQNETTEIVQSAIQKLDEKHRMPLLLVSMEGLSVEDAAEVLELPRGTVLSRLHRARQKLKNILQPLLPSPSNSEGRDEA